MLLIVSLSVKTMKRSVSAYPQRRYLRRLERGWARLEGLANRLSEAGEPLRPYNPLYHLEPLLIFLLLLLAATGIVLLLLYRPGADRAYESVQAISSGWAGALVRSVHRYASGASVGWRGSAAGCWWSCSGLPARRAISWSGTRPRNGSPGTR